MGSRFFGTFVRQQSAFLQVGDVRLAAVPSSRRSQLAQGQASHAALRRAPARGYQLGELASSSGQHLRGDGYHCVRLQPRCRHPSGRRVMCAKVDHGRAA